MCLGSLVGFSSKLSAWVIAVEKGAIAVEKGDRVQASPNTQRGPSAQSLLTFGGGWADPRVSREFSGEV
jgi:hypothetical protein